MEIISTFLKLLLHTAKTWVFSLISSSNTRIAIDVPKGKHSFTPAHSVQEHTSIVTEQNLHSHSECFHMMMQSPKSIKFSFANSS